MEGVGGQFISVRKVSSFKLTFGVKKVEEYTTLESESRFSTSLSPTVRRRYRFTSIRAPM